MKAKARKPKKIKMKTKKTFAKRRFGDEKSRSCKKRKRVQKAYKKREKPSLYYGKRAKGKEL